MPDIGRILVTGCRGQLGTELMLYLSDRYSVAGVDIDELDITNKKGVMNLVSLIKPAILIHAAGYTDVDGSESNEGLAMAVNADGTENLALACRAVGAKMVYYSTDYVFDGTKGSPYIEDDIPNPQSVYGKSKLEGEERLRSILDDYITMRISWVYSSYGRNFVKTIIRLGKEQLSVFERGIPAAPLQVVNDQMGNPTWTYDIVRQTDEILKRGLFGVFHSSSEKTASWFDFTKAVFDELQMPVKIEPCTSEQFPRPAVRPKYSVMENLRLKQGGINLMREYRTALHEFITANKEKLIS
jgi:dTDP-4-dehydrorhamnose reductase